MASRLRRFATNTISMLTTDVLNRGTTLVVYILVARYLGTQAFGQLSLATSLLHLFHVFSLLGLQNYITREVAKDRSATDRFLLNGNLLVGTTSLAAVGIVAIFVQLMDYSDDTSHIIMLLSLSLFPQSMSTVCESVLRAWERMHYIAYANVPPNLAKVVFAYAALSGGYGLDRVVAVLLGCRAAITILEWFLIARFLTRPRIRFEWGFCVSMVGRARSFFGIDGLVVVGNEFNTLVLSKFASVVEVGLFNAANQLLLPIRLLFQSIMSGVFPAMCRRHGARGSEGLQRIAEMLSMFLLALAVPAAVGLFMLADDLLTLTYGKQDFAQAATVLRVTSLNLILIAITQSLGHALLAGGQERQTLRIVAVNLVVRIVLSVILIHQFGLLGAAISALASRVVDAVQHLLQAARLMSRISIVALLWKPALASLGMAVALKFFAFPNVLLNVILGVLVYCTILTPMILPSILSMRSELPRR